MTHSDIGRIVRRRRPVAGSLTHAVAGERNIALPEWDGFTVQPEQGKPWDEQSADVRKAIEGSMKLWTELEEVSGLIFSRNILVHLAYASFVVS